jgi:hypothetical protein
LNTVFHPAVGVEAHACVVGKQAIRWPFPHSLMQCFCIELSLLTFHNQVLPAQLTVL